MWPAVELQLPYRCDACGFDTTATIQGLRSAPIHVQTSAATVLAHVDCPVCRATTAHARALDATEARIAASTKTQLRVVPASAAAVMGVGIGIFAVGDWASSPWLAVTAVGAAVTVFCAAYGLTAFPRDRRLVPTADVRLLREGEWVQAPVRRPAARSARTKVVPFAMLGVGLLAMIGTLVALGRWLTSYAELRLVEPTALADRTVRVDGERVDTTQPKPISAALSVRSLEVRTGKAHRIQVLGRDGANAFDGTLPASATNGGLAVVESDPSVCFIEQEWTYGRSPTRHITHRLDVTGGMIVLPRSYWYAFEQPPDHIDDAQGKTETRWALRLASCDGP